MSRSTSTGRDTGSGMDQLGSMRSPRRFATTGMGTVSPPSKGGGAPMTKRHTNTGDVSMVKTSSQALPPVSRAKSEKPMKEDNPFGLAGTPCI
eukprot:CAMPEP_0195150728 /NCGR_PEP_ID=MMETSP0448-20130528/179329_1 /TAXON_ID=66468 /ORGANISM="Heterocapsa triquestra, Strain CCMP 448" /LENGTH=92 /DNA_ID=CAMNT_0040189419 /DNA_START=17 /DNA_END=292 /DNA_ORIENTATION=+